jgi:hypothetical protein
MAVREGFEPSKPYDLHTFQACSFGHSALTVFFFIANCMLLNRLATQLVRGVAFLKIARTLAQRHDYFKSVIVLPAWD